MKLASYGSNAGYIDDEECRKSLEEYFGFCPILCICAECDMDFTAQSILFDVKEPENLYFFDGCMAEHSRPIKYSAFVECCKNPDKRNWDTVLDPTEESDTIYLVDAIPEDHLFFDLGYYSTFEIHWSEDVPEESKEELNVFLKKLKKDTVSLLRVDERENRYAIKKAMEQSGLLTTIYRMYVENDDKDTFFLYQASIQKELNRLFKESYGYRIKDSRRILYNQICHMFRSE